MFSIEPLVHSGLLQDHEGFSQPRQQPVPTSAVRQASRHAARTESLKLCFFPQAFRTVNSDHTHTHTRVPEVLIHNLIHFYIALLLLCLLVLIPLAVYLPICLLFSLFACCLFASMRIFII